MLFGRYSDNNKSIEKVEKWNESDALFKEKKYKESIATFFDYLRDEEIENVIHEPNGIGGNTTKVSNFDTDFYSHNLIRPEVS